MRKEEDYVIYEHKQKLHGAGSSWPTWLGSTEFQNKEGKGTPNVWISMNKGLGAGKHSGCERVNVMFGEYAPPSPKTIRRPSKVR